MRKPRLWNIRRQSGTSNFERLGKYFSALSNEANLRNAECGWLLFGVTDKREICGTTYRQEQRRPSVGLRSLKHEIAGNLNNGLTFEEIYEFDVDGKRVVRSRYHRASSPRRQRGVVFHGRGRTSPLHRCLGSSWRRFGDSRVPTGRKRYPLRRILTTLTPEAVRFACERYVDKYAVKQPAVKSLDEGEMLRKMGFLVHGHISECLRLCFSGAPTSTALPRWCGSSDHLDALRLRRARGDI